MSGSKNQARIRGMMRKASTGDAPDDVQMAARDLFECGHALADDPTNVEAMRHMLDAAYRVVQAARLHVVNQRATEQASAASGEKT